MRVLRLTLVGITILTLSAATGVALLPTLPSSVAIHFGVGGDPDSPVATPLGAPLVPAIGVGALLITRLADTSSIGTDVPPVFDAILATFFVYVQTPVLAYNLSARFNIAVAVVPVIVTFDVVAVVPDRTG